MTQQSEIFAPLTRTKVGVAALVGALASTTWAEPAHADQFVLFDATFDYSWDDAMTSSPSQSHYYVTEENWLNTERPSDWVSPANYRDGSVHIRVEVLDKPAGDQQVGWALCYIANVGAYGCPYTDYYTSEGVFETDVAMDSFWTSGPITWESGIKQVDLVYTINNSGSGHVHNFPELKDATTPTSVRITMVQVSQGDTYDPSILEDPAGTGGASGSGGSDPGETGGSSSGGGDPGSGGEGSGGIGTPETGGASSTGGDGATNPGDLSGTGAAASDPTGGGETGAADGQDSDGSGESGGCGGASIAGSTVPSTPWLFLIAPLLAGARSRRRR